MPLYRYTASDKQGKKSKGTERAAEPRELREKLREKGLYVIECAEDDGKTKRVKLNDKQLGEFCRDLGTMLESGVPLIRAVKILSQRDMKPKLKKIYENLYSDLQSGLMLSEAMTNQNGTFPDLLISMLKASESTGGMDETAKKMAVHYDKSHKINQKVISAALYPAILAVVTLAVMLIIFLFVLPKFFEVFNDLNAPMPLLTQGVLNLSMGIRNHWKIILVVIVGVIFIIKALTSQENVKYKLDQFKLKLPVAGKLLKIIYTARFARTLSSSYSSGLSMIVALENTRDTIGNRYIASQFPTLIKSVREGQALSASIEKVDGIDPKLPASILVGEETGRLDSMLESIADSFDYEADIAIQRMTTLMEPTMIIFMAIIIGIIIVSVILPLPALYNTIGAGA